MIAKALVVSEFFQRPRVSPAKREGLIFGDFKAFFDDFPCQFLSSVGKVMFFS